MSTKREKGTNASSSTSGEEKIEPISAASQGQEQNPVDEQQLQATLPSSLGLITSPQKITENNELATEKPPKEPDDVSSSDPSLEHPTMPNLKQGGEMVPQPTRITPAASADSTDKPRQVIAVSASKGPAAFFNLARKFLVTDEICDLSALEGAIVSAVDAAHLLERSKLATIIRIHTSYVTVEPKRKKQHPSASEASSPSDQLFLSSPTTYAAAVAGTEGPVHAASPSAPGSRPLSYPGASGPMAAGLQGQHKGVKGQGSRELRRARIVITVKRTEGYKQWLEENPLQAIIAGDGDDDVVDPQPDIELSTSMPR